MLTEVYHHYHWTRNHHPLWLQMLLAVGIFAILVALSPVTYLLVERPMQNLGRQVGRWLDARLGHDRIPDTTAVTPATD